MDLEALRVAVYRSFAETGQAPATRDLSEQFDTTGEAVVDGLHGLARARHLVLDGDDHVVMAHPFASIR